MRNPNTSTSAVFRITNVSGAAILLPWQPIEPRDLEVFPINAEAIVDEQLMELLGGLVISVMVEYRQTEQPGKDVHTIEKAHEPIDPTSGFFQSWQLEYGNNLVQAKDLLEIASKYFAQDIKENSHGATVWLGKKLRQLSRQDRTAWHIEILSRSKKSFYRLSR